MRTGYAVVCENQVVKTFASRKEALQALMAIRFYGLTERVIVGDPKNPTMEMYFASGRAPYDPM